MLMDLCNFVIQTKKKFKKKERGFNNYFMIMHFCEYFLLFTTHLSVAADSAMYE